MSSADRLISRIIIEGTPRAAKLKKTKSGVIYNSRKKFMQDCQLLVKKQYRKKPYSGPVKIIYFFGFSIPKSWAKAKKAEAAQGGVTHTGRPDYDNLEKLYNDCIKKIVIADDSQIINSICKKEYASVARVEIEIYAADNQPMRAPTHPLDRGRPPVSKDRHGVPLDFTSKMAAIDEQESLGRGRPPRYEGKYDMYDERSIRKMRKEEIVYRVAAMGGSHADCALAAGISRSAVTQHYRHIVEEGRSHAKMRIRSAQWAKAFEGDSVMLKHVGITYCEDQRNTGEGILPAETVQSAVEYMSSKKYEADRERDELED